MMHTTPKRLSLRRRARLGLIVAAALSIVGLAAGAVGATGNTTGTAIVTRGTPTGLTNVYVKSNALSVTDGLATAFTNASVTTIAQFATAQSLNWGNAANFLVSWRQASTGTGIGLTVVGDWQSKTSAGSYADDATANGTLDGTANSTVLIKVPSASWESSDSAAVYPNGTTTVGLTTSSGTAVSLVNSTNKGGTAQGELDVALNTTSATSVQNLLADFYTDLSYQLVLTFTLAAN